MKRTRGTLAVAAAALIGIACGTKDAGKGTAGRERSFGEDAEFLKEHADVIVLARGDARVAVTAAYQARVMTSTTGGDSGPSFGWLNYEAIARGLLSDEERKGRPEDHMYAFGGEERFWIGPEGGQFAIYFAPGVEFKFENWHVPPAIDTETYALKSKTATSAAFEHSCRLTNWSGTVFDVGIAREVRLLEKNEIEERFGLTLPAGVRPVAYETENVITNKGDAAWTEDTGMLSIWILGMYKPSPTTTTVIPFKAGDEEDLGPKVNDTYFGKVPAKYLRVEDDVLFFKGDGTYRSKIGVSPRRSKGIAGSYDATGKVLNLVTYNVPEDYVGYVNSMWEEQEDPFSGDAINSYNDGSTGPGQPPLGPFYEIEASSSAAPLEPGESHRHVQTTAHFSGPEDALDAMARSALGVPLAKIVSALGD